MPVRVGKCGDKWCVKEPDGSTVPGGEHDTEQEAIDHAAAINANTEKGAMTLEKQSTTTFSDNTAHVVFGDNAAHEPTKVGSLQFPDLEPEIKKAIQEKGLEEAMMYGPESFDDLDELREYSEKTSAITKVVSDFMSLVGNVLSWPAPDTAARIKRLANEMVERLPEEDEDLSPQEEGMQEEEEKASDEDQIDNVNKNGFFIWKDESGEYRWLGVFSNKFRDDDRPAEILSEKAHVDFIERVEKGELPYPDLYVWHIKSPIGKADLLAYDDAGFSIAAGTIEEEFALALMNSNEDLAMSHGMPSEYIERSKEDPTVITAYVSTEVSVLPRRAAANKRTEFRILKEETMAIVPAEKRAQVVGLLGEDLTKKLETDLDVKAGSAIAEGIEFKEETVDASADAAAEDVSTEEIEAEAETEEAPAESEVKDEDSVDEIEAAEAHAEDAQPEEKGEEEPTQPEGEDVKSEKEELAEVLAAVVGPLLDSQAQLGEVIKSLADRIDALEASREQASESEPASEKADEQAGDTPTASIVDLFMKRLSEPARSVIGTKEAAVHGNSSLAKAKPEETEFDEAEGAGANGGLFWRQFN